MTHIRHRLRPHVVAELDASRSPRERGDNAEAWRRLERAHVLSQPSPWLHTRVHWRMLVLAVRVGDLRELAGQTVRLALAALASALGRYPAGNTGRARMPIKETVPIPDDLRSILSSAGASEQR